MWRTSRLVLLLSQEMHELFSTLTASPAPIEFIGDRVRPHVLGLPQESVLEGALQRSLQRVEVAVGAVALQAVRTEGRNWPGSPFGPEPLAVVLLNR